MESVTFYWTVVAGITGAIWVLVQLFRDRVAQSISRTDTSVNRLITIDQLVINNPDIQRYLSQTAHHPEDYFRKQDRLEEDLFYKAKTLVYMQLNTFDEVLSLSSRHTGLASLFGYALLIELSDWENYILAKIRHPLYRSILNHEQDIFGDALRKYWVQHKQQVQSAGSDPFTW